MAASTENVSLLGPTAVCLGTCAAVSLGSVYLVGAGPGAVGLLTVRAVEVLSSCDAVLYDRLVPLEIVRLAKPSAQVRYVGKEGNVNTDTMKTHQDDISSQLVTLALQGLSVCRLKGGDPMIFGRAGEEMEGLVAAGVPYEVVPAVTAVLSAGADACIPLTFRKVATSLRIHTMNPTTTRDEKFDWAQFAVPQTTYALYMGLAALDTVCARMMAAGVAGSTPMAVIDRSSLPCMQVVTGTVETLPSAVHGRTDLEGPALVLLGDAVGLRERLVGSKPPAPPPSDARLAVALATLPSMGDEALKSLRARIDDILASRVEAAPAAVGSVLPAKRPVSD